MSYWDFDAKNGLAGVEPSYETLPDTRIVIQPDPTDPAVLPQETILYALRTSEAARTSFRTVFPTLSADAQARLTDLIEANPRQSSIQEDDQACADRIQSHAIRSIPIRTVGRRGGKGGRGA